MAGILAAISLVAARAPANVQEQRARLPPPATCNDPVAGEWMSHDYFPHAGDWYLIRMVIRRVPGDPVALEMTSTAEHWNGAPDEPSPPPCRPGLHHRRMGGEGRGTFRSYDLDLMIVPHGTEEVFCGEPAPRYLDTRVAGTIDPALQEFQSMMSAPEWGAAPTVFRRIRCLEGSTPPGPPRPTIVPRPPTAPPSGCSCLR